MFRALPLQCSCCAGFSGRDLVWVPWRSSPAVLILCPSLYPALGPFLVQSTGHTGPLVCHWEMVWAQPLTPSSHPALSPVQAYDINLESRCQLVCVTKGISRGPFQHPETELSAVAAPWTVAVVRHHALCCSTSGRCFLVYGRMGFV